MPSSWTKQEDGDLMELSSKQLEEHIEQSLQGRKMKKVKRRLPPSSVGSPPTNRKAKFLEVGANGLLQEQSEIEETSPSIIPGDKGSEVQSKELVLSQKSEGQNSEEGEFTPHEVLTLRNHYLGKNLKRQKTAPEATQFPAHPLKSPLQEELSVHQVLRPDLSQMDSTHKDEAISDMQKKIKVIEAFETVEGLTCPICMDFIIGCRIAICGHSFCHQCISECLIRKKDCPQCRKPIRKKMLQMSLIVDNAVKMKVYSKKLTGNGEELERWQERITKYHKWLDGHRLTAVKAGERVDVCDTELIWCRATVELVIKSANRKDLLYLHYEGWNRKYDEYLYIDSHRVAPLGLYTERTDIPKYRMGTRNTGLSMMYAVVLQNAAEEARMADYERRMQMRPQPEPIAEDQEGEEQAMQDEQEDQEDEEPPHAEDVPPVEQPVVNSSQEPESSNLQQQNNQNPPASQPASQQPSEAQQITEAPGTDKPMFGDQKVAFEKLKAQQDFKNKQQQSQSPLEEAQPSSETHQPPPPSSQQPSLQQLEQPRIQPPNQDPTNQPNERAESRQQAPAAHEQNSEEEREEENFGSSLVDYSQPTTKQGKK